MKIDGILIEGSDVKADESGIIEGNDCISKTAFLELPVENN